MKKNNNKLFYALITILLAFTLVSCSSKNETLSNQESAIKNRVMMDQGLMYASYTVIEDAFYASDIVVYGEIIGFGKPHFPPYDEEKKFCQTPVEIKVLDCITDNYENPTLVFDSSGGVIGNTEYISTAYRTKDFKIGDKILVFLVMDDRYNTYNEISPANVFYGGKDGYTRVSTDFLKSAKSNTKIEIKPVISLEELAGLLHSEYNLYAEKNEFVTK